MRLNEQVTGKREAGSTVSSVALASRARKGSFPPPYLGYLSTICNESTAGRRTSLQLAVRIAEGTISIAGACGTVKDVQLFQTRERVQPGRQTALNLGSFEMSVNNPS